MMATGAMAAGTECIPTRAATVVKIFRMVTRCAKPAVRWLGLPFAEWAANAAEVRLLVGICSDGAAGIFDRASLLKQHEVREPITGLRVSISLEKRCHFV
jgi:hypothetical protein